jgi:hypothetical protein
MNCYLGLNDTVNAMKMIKKLETYDDSFIIDNTGVKFSFKELAKKAYNLFTKRKDE